jgi:hypothetical protein
MSTIVMRCGHLANLTVGNVKAFAQRGLPEMVPCPFGCGLQAFVEDPTSVRQSAGDADRHDREA